MIYVMLLFKNYDRDLREIALSDLSMELIINKTSSISEVLTTVLEFLRSLDCEVSYLLVFEVSQCWFLRVLVSFESGYLDLAIPGKTC